ALYELNETPAVNMEGNILGMGVPGWSIRSNWQQYYVVNESGELKVFTMFWYFPHGTQEEFINQTMPLVGSDRITVTNDSIRLEPGMSLTLDGMAKGYAVDAAITVLKEKGIKRALVDAGGDIATLGTKPGGKKWVTGLRDPGDRSTSVTEFELSGQAIATSGNYERYFDENASVGHIMDPSTGRSIFRCSSATIIADNCTVADILATGVFVLGAEDGIRLVETLPGIEALLLGYEDPKEIFRSSGLGDYEIED
ncbi:MAG: FAD:protein FMN transferase, partial [Thermoplasmata archaeon]|nr:FAD:protein FMN transferase [Thermoplasmata archaeon]